MQSENISATIDLLERIVAQGTHAEIAEIVGHLERLKFLAWNRHHDRDDVARPRPPDDQDRYLTIGEVAARLRLSKSYCYELARRGSLPVTPLGKTGARGKAFRVKLSELEEWEARLSKRSPDSGLSTMRRSRHDGQRASLASGAAGDYAGSTRATGRRPSDHAIAAGTRPGSGLGMGRATGGTADLGEAEGAA
jgi:excisionase family DNA binding protein